MLKQGEGDDRGQDGWMASLNQLSKLGEVVKDGEAWQAAVHGVTKSWTRLNNRIVDPCCYVSYPELPFLVAGSGSLRECLHGNIYFEGFK